jgi:hypothetical protein
MSENVFSIAREFSPNPGPRWKRQGANSGEALRPKLLHVLQSRHGRIKVLLDGTKGMGSSFLDEAFGGLIRYHGQTRDELRKRFNFISEIDPSYICTIYDSLDRAQQEVDKGR